MKRFLNGIQKNHARTEREKDQAKAEIERLNHLAGASTPSGSTKVAPALTAAPRPVKSSSNTLSAADQQRQWTQLAEMGIAVPGDSGAAITASGGWQVVSRKPVSESTETVEDKLNIGVRKRKFEGQEEEEEAGETVVKRGWGSTTKTYPGANSTSDDLSSLLTGAILRKKDSVKESPQDHDSKEVVTHVLEHQNGTATTESAKIERPLSGDIVGDEPEVAVDAPVKSEALNQDVKSIPQEPDTEVLGPVFKKRKAKTSAKSGVT